jgi:hypothetical protein
MNNISNNNKNTLCSYIISKIPCVEVLRIVHVQDMHDHLIDDLNLAIYLGVESSGFCKLGVQQ